MKHAPAIAYTILGIAAGLVISRLPEYRWKYEVDVVDLATLLIGAFVALLLQSYIADKSGKHREEKLLLVAQLSKLQLSAEAVRQRYHASLITKWTASEKKTLLADLRTLSNSVRLFECSAKSCENQNYLAKAEDIKNLFLQFKKQLTSGPFPSKPLPAADISIVDGAWREFVECIVKAQFEINRC